MKRKSAFTLIELLVVIAIIALLVSILMPALGRAKELAKQVQCAANLSGLGKAMAVYQSDFREMNPSVASTYIGKSGYNGGGNSLFNSNSKPQRGHYNDGYEHWNNASGAFVPTSGMFGPDGGWLWPTTGGCLFLLVKYADVTPEVFLCPSAEQAMELTLDIARNGLTTPAIKGNIDVTSWNDVYDFPCLNFLNYSYNDPFGQLLDSSASASSPVMADMTPACADPASSGRWNNNIVSYKTSAQSNALFYGKFLASPDASRNGAVQTPLTTPFNPDWTSDDQNKWPGNSFNHATEVENVVFADAHVKKNTTPCVGVDKDNIYSRWGASAADATVWNKQIGYWGTGGGNDRNDAYLGN